MKVWSKGVNEGKFLVVRRDGTVPAWPWFVLGARDPAAPAALRAYADEADRLTKTGLAASLGPEYTASVRELAADFEGHRIAYGTGDPAAGPHRTDDPTVIAAMRHQPSTIHVLPSAVGPKITVEGLDAEIAARKPTPHDTAADLEFAAWLDAGKALAIRRAPIDEETLAAYEHLWGVGADVPEALPLLVANVRRLQAGYKMAVNTLAHQVRPGVEQRSKALTAEMNKNALISEELAKADAGVARLAKECEQVKNRESMALDLVGELRTLLSTTTDALRKIHGASVGKIESYPKALDAVREEAVRVLSSPALVAEHSTAPYAPRHPLAPPVALNRNLDAEIATKTEFRDECARERREMRSERALERWEKRGAAAIEQVGRLTAELDVARAGSGQGVALSPELRDRARNLGEKMIDALVAERDKLKASCAEIATRRDVEKCHGCTHLPDHLACSPCVAARGLGGVA
jgi:hypothetical protein